MVIRPQRSLLAGLLVCVTLFWGVVVADHQHSDTQHHHCDICLLPQMAMAAPAIAEIPSHTPVTPVAEQTYQDISPPLLPAYTARAPPIP